MLSRLLPDPLQTFPLGVTGECEGRAGSGESSSLLFWFPLISNVWAPPGHGFRLLCFWDQASMSVLVSCPDAKTLCSCRV